MKYKIKYKIIYAFWTHHFQSRAGQGVTLLLIK